MILIDRTEQTRHITQSNQRSQETGERLSMFNSRSRTRALSDIDSIVLHQTGYFQSARGNRIDAYDYTIAHFVVLPILYVIQVRPLETRLNSIASDYGIHIEFVGCFYSDRYDCRSTRRTRPRGRCTAGLIRRGGGEFPLMDQVLNGQDLMRYLVSLPSLNGSIEHVLAHRQLSTIHRENCPGPHIWYNLGRWAVNSLGLSDSRPNTRPHMRTIPPSWNDGRFQIPTPCARASTAPRGGRGRLSSRPEGVASYATRQVSVEAIDPD